MPTRWTCLTALCLILALLAGCAKEYPAELEYPFSPYPVLNAGEKEVFTLNPPNTWSAADLSKEMKTLFGTPRDPLVYVTTNEGEEDSAVIAALKLEPRELAAGSKLYRKYCLHCHGLVGDGNGSTAGPIAAPFLVPRPRDFRQAKFKFRSTAIKSSDGKFDTTIVTTPSRLDIARTIRQGVPSASMPSFNLLGDEDIERLVSYVMHLSIRGRVEYDLFRNLEAEPDVLLRREAKRWQRESASTFVPPPPSKPWDELRADRERGRKIYLSEASACASCHGKDGRASKVETPTNEGRKNDWGDKNVPRDLTLGVYRGGSRPIDIFYRIKLGVAGSGMPAASLPDEDVWYLVDYVLSLPQEK